MEIETKTEKGTAIKLYLKDGKVYADFFSPKLNIDITARCERWSKKYGGVEIYDTKTSKPGIAKIPSNDWHIIEEAAVKARKEKARAELTLVKETHMGNITSVDGYTLSTHVNKEDWNKISHLVHYCDMRCNDSIWSGYKFRGWIIKDGKEAEVEELLNIKPENRIEYKTEQKKKEREAKKLRAEFVRSLNPEFSALNPVTPNPDKGQVDVDGEKYGIGANIYGGGWWYVIQADKIWYVANNGSDGDLWSLNNVRTGGAGAIGQYVSFDAALASKIRKLTKLN